MRYRFWKKLRSRSGESIGETLVALLISTMGIMLLAGMITASTRMVIQSRDAFDDYYAVNNAVAKHDAEAINSYFESGSVTITIKDSSNKTLLTVPDITYYKDTKLGRSPVISYGVPYISGEGGTP